ncbi:hypothetical protein RvY_12984 [Ramazzottius varieornatus]|uniref:Uncharacterized protein n=1 Tax=Ramazzottius varieornatus TaxID=947166 RepID=A0A1D1VTW0_RAMVA|nr:hypothetical protein RvY_12984 [Ramazzottius varieornatus]
MAIRAVQVAAKTLLSDEGETVLKSAARMIRATGVEESGAVMENTLTQSMTVETVSGLGTQAESGLGRVLGETLARTPKEAEINLGRAGEIKEINLNTPKEVELPDSKGIDVKPGKIDVAREMVNNVPTDPEGLVLAVEGKNNQGPIGNQEVGEKRGVVEISNQADKKREMESSTDGKQQVEVGKKNEGPEVKNLRSEMVE